mgnify:FL=1
MAPYGRKVKTHKGATDDRSQPLNDFAFNEVGAAMPVRAQSGAQRLT